MRPTIWFLVFSSIFLLAGWSLAEEPVNLGISLPDSSAKDSIRCAVTDFLAVVAGKQPVHAVHDESAALPADGGTDFYVGNGYKLTVVKSLVRLGGIGGYMYGPIIQFDKAILVGNWPNISRVSFYANESLRKLLENK